MSHIPYGRQQISAEDIEAVVAVLRSDYLTQGPAVPAFEQAVGAQCGAPHAVAVNSATSALHLACVALGLGPGDRLWTSPITFVASANCARYCGAEVDFVDVDPQTAAMSPRHLADKLQTAARTGRLPKVLVPVHFSGRSCDMAEIARLARRHGVRVVEDASHAVGASHAGRPVGDCKYSDLAVFSFHPVKIVTTAEGGVLTTRDASLAARLRRLRSHGITRDADMATKGEGAWYYEQIDLGYNYRLTDVQAALGTSQMSRLAEFLRRRRELAVRYERLLAGAPLGLPPPSAESAWHLYVVQVDAGRRRAAFDAMRAADIGVNVHYIPVHLQPYYRGLGFKPGDFPAAEAYYARAITLPLHAGLTETQQDRVVETLRRALQ
jgi:UDP-4-amino-4,6-dideoxy-N-acetyl-beta-L-altrosamine transaminase